MDPENPLQSHSVSVLPRNRSFDKQMSNISNTTSLTCQMMTSSKDSSKIPQQFFFVFYLFIF